jgi:putative aminopeptidase FrvX
VGIDTTALVALCDSVGVATACGPPLGWVTERLPGWQRHVEPDGFAFYRALGAELADVRVVYLSHIDEVGAWVGPRADGDGSFLAAPFGLTPASLAGADLVAQDYLDETGATTRPARAEVRMQRGPRARGLRWLGRRVHHHFASMVADQLVVHAEHLGPFEAVCTFRGEGLVDGDYVVAKAIDPRSTVFAMTEAAGRIERADTACLFYMAEECSTSSVRKAARFLQDRLPSLRLIVSGDSVEIGSVIPSAPESTAVMRLREKTDFIDPNIALRLRDRLRGDGMELPVVADSRASKTHFVSWVAPTVSMGIPARGQHTPRTRVHLAAIEHAIEVLTRIPSLLG